MILELLERLFGGHGNSTSRTKVKQRLKFILAHDRAALTPDMFDKMRREIMEVVSKYVEIDREAMEINLETDRRMTAVIANLPIRAVRTDEEIEQLELQVSGTNEAIADKSLKEPITAPEELTGLDRNLEEQLERLPPPN